MGFNLADYETVESRLEKFWKEYPDGRISTELVLVEDHRYIIKSYLYRTYLDAQPYATGFAEEKDSDRGVNSTSALENCETSSIGRALANAGFAAKGKRPSQSEMVKVQLAGRSNTAANPAKEGKGLNIESPVDYWKIQDPKDELATIAVTQPPTLNTAINLLQDELQATEVKQAPKCQHGYMISKSGISSKTNRPYTGFTCSSAKRAEQCPAIWL
jgi:hypothetical protein